MGFIQRAFTPPGTGGREAAAIQAQADAQAASAKVAQAAARPPDVPTIAAAPPAPQGFQAQLQAGSRQKQATTAKSILGAAATSGQMAGTTLGTGSSQKTSKLG